MGTEKNASKDTSQILCSNCQTQRASAWGALVDDSYKTVSENLWSTYSDGTLLILPQVVLLKLTSFTLNILKECLSAPYFRNILSTDTLGSWKLPQFLCCFTFCSPNLSLFLGMSLQINSCQSNNSKKSHNRDRISLLCSTFHLGENREGIFSPFFLNSCG